MIFFLLFVTVPGHRNIVSAVIKGIHNTSKMNHGRRLTSGNFFSKCCSATIHELELNTEEVSSDTGANVTGLILGSTTPCFFLIYTQQYARTIILFPGLALILLEIWVPDVNHGYEFGYEWRYQHAMRQEENKLCQFYKQDNHAIWGLTNFLRFSKNCVDWFLFQEGILQRSMSACTFCPLGISKFAIWWEEKYSEVFIKNKAL